MASNDSSPQGFFNKIENTINNIIGKEPIDWDYRAFKQKVLRANPSIRREKTRDNIIRKSYDSWVDQSKPAIKFKTEELERLIKKPTEMVGLNIATFNRERLAKKGFSELLNTITVEVNSPAEKRQFQQVVARYFETEFKNELAKGKIVNTDKLLSAITTAGLKAQPEMSMNIVLSSDINKTTLLTGARPDYLKVDSMVLNKSFSPAKTSTASMYSTSIKPVLTASGALRKFGVSQPKSYSTHHPDHANVNPALKNLFGPEK